MRGQIQPRSSKRKKATTKPKREAAATIESAIACSAELKGSRIHFKKGAMVNALRKKLGLSPDQDIICSALVHLPRTAVSPEQDDPGTVVDVRC